MREIEDACRDAFNKAIYLYSPEKDGRHGLKGEGETYVFTSVLREASKCVYKLANGKMHIPTSHERLHNIQTDRVINGYSKEIDRSNDVMDAEEGCDRLRKVLPEKYYDLLYRLHGLEQGYKDIARDWGVSIQAVAKMAKRAEVKVRRLLEEGTYK